VAYLGYTLRMRTLFRGWPIMVNDTHTRRRRLTKLIDLPINNTHHILLLSGGNSFRQLKVSRAHHCLKDSEMRQQVIILHYVARQLAETVQLAFSSINLYLPCHRPRPNKQCTLFNIQQITEITVLAQSSYISLSWLDNYFTVTTEVNH